MGGSGEKELGPSRSRDLQKAGEKGAGAYRLQGKKELGRP